MKGIRFQRGGVKKNNRKRTKVEGLDPPPPGYSDALHLDTQLSRTTIEPIGAQMVNMKTVVALEYFFYDLNKRRVLEMRGEYSIQGKKADLY